VFQFDSLVQTATGFNLAEAESFAAFKGIDTLLLPKALPMQALDHAAGYLLAFGINAALCKTVTVHISVFRYCICMLKLIHCAGRRLVGRSRVPGGRWTVDSVFRPP
jgi:ascorbate-specific PTS system EIIC-type component UlaA